MRPGELWDPPPASDEHPDFVIAVLDAALNASRIDPLVLDLMANSECVRESNLYGFDPAFGISRVSSLLVDQMAHSYTVGASHMQGILDAIKSLEGIGTPTNAKEMDESVVHVRLGEIMGDAKLTDRQKANHIAYFAVDESFRRRNREQRMTGEWVVFARDDAGANHYLAAGAHAPKAVCQALLELIRARCEPKHRRGSPA